jgi:excisionase family DNA binding protein
MPEESFPRLLDVPGVCEATNLGPTTIAGLIASGELRSIKVGRRRLIPHEALEQFIADRLADAG